MSISTELSGGCLCGAVRFTITLPEGTQWPLKARNGTCQCTMCRKQTGSLLPRACAFPTASISPPLKDNPAFKTYKSSASAYRGFCGTCGSPMTFNDVKDTEWTDIWLGVFDEDVLCGTRDEANAWEDEHGRHVPRVGGFGKELTAATEHLFLENAVPGVTDDLNGTKWVADRKDGKSFTGKMSEFVRPS